MPKGIFMNKWVVFGSIALNVILIIWLVAVLTPEEPVLVDLSIHTQQDLEKAQEVKAGITSEQLTKLMGNPVLREFDQEKEEWHYCKTDHNVDEYVVFKLQDDKVVSSKYYTVSWLDVVYHHTQTPTEALIEAGGMGDCKLTAKWGSYSKAAPNKSSKKDAQKARASS